MQQSRAGAHARDPIGLRAPGLLSLAPGLCGLAAYAAYPRLVRPLDAIDALGPWVAATSLDVGALVAHGDALALLAGIVASGVCWFHTRPR